MATGGGRGADGLRAAIGLDLGGTSMAGGILTAQGRLLHRREQPTPAAAGADGVLDRMRELIGALLEQGRSEGLDVRGIGLGIPGVVDTRRGVCAFSPNIPFRDTPIAGPIAEAFGLPAYVDNDVRVHTLAEWCFGAGQGVANFVVVKVGTGIGGGLVLGGRPYAGPTASAGEVGHQTLCPEGPPCGCGNRGCLEALAAGPAIARRAREALAGSDGASSRLRPLFEQDPGGVTAAAVADAAQAGDPLAVRVLEETGRWLGIGLANLVTVLNPDLIIVGGRVSRAGDHLLGPARREVAARVMAVPARHVRIVASPLGDDAGPMGAAMLVPEIRESLAPPE